MRDNNSSRLELQSLRASINENYLIDEAFCVSELMHSSSWPEHVFVKTETQARKLVENIRSKQVDQGSMQAFIHEYDLSSEEGVVLMCLAESLLRIPDDETADRLIRDKISPAQWDRHLGQSQSLFVNASTWGLMMTGRLLKRGISSAESWEVFSRLIARMGEPVIRTVLRQAMKIMGAQYVMGTTIKAALKRSRKEFHENYSFSFDMLGEAALSTGDAQRYFNAYKNAIDELGREAVSDRSFFTTSSISIKLSALHPRYEFLKIERVNSELIPNVQELVEYARERNVAVTLDAEEAERLELSLDIFQAVIESENVRGWNGFGLAVQAYQKRALPVLKWIKKLAEMTRSRIPVRLVKGAYWDTEIKRAQEQGLESYPVFTRKCNTDVSYLACANFLLQNSKFFYPQFATHNAHTLAAICQLAKTFGSDYEFQRLHGMGENLYDEVIDEVQCRVYAPVGSYEDLLPYLVRRLLENGANSSFVNRIEDRNILVEQIVSNPVTRVESLNEIANPKIPLPANLYQGYRTNSRGEHVADRFILRQLQENIRAFKSRQWVSPILQKEKAFSGTPTEIFNPADRKQLVGKVYMADAETVKHCLTTACDAAQCWKYTRPEIRLDCVNRFAELLHEHRFELYALCMFEAGKTLNDAIAEVREAIDFCYYYHRQAQTLFVEDLALPGPTGESNRLHLQGRGVFLCISPWNFPLAIFTGQVIAALISGNTVIAKPSSNTSLIAARAVDLMHSAGFSKEIVQLLPCKASMVTEYLLSSPKLSGVVFTGSFDTAININRTLAAREAAIVPLIAETGGLNVMLADSSALPEQVVKDAITSAFQSAGQRCSALRILIVQQDIYPRVRQLLVEAMKELKIGNPLEFDTDIPPVIDQNAKLKLERYKKIILSKGKLIYEMENVDADTCFVAPAVFAIDSLDELNGEQFGPILHLMSFDAEKLPKLLRDINAMGYGLTLGIHSRINENIDLIATTLNVGNVYVNRNMIGAVVGVQPFGGEGLSGTGPKAGGPHYLLRFCTEKTLTINTAAVGGNAALLALDDD